MISVGKIAAAVVVLSAAATMASQAQVFNTILSFDGLEGTGSRYDMSLVQGVDGKLYGTAPDGGAYGSYGSVYTMAPDGTLTTLYSFGSRLEDGAVPLGGLVLAMDGNFYGTTDSWGANLSGTVFKITPGGTLTTLYTFCSLANCADGANPQGTLVQGIDGSLYGTTWAGGTAETCTGGCGTVFKITPGGALTTLHNFLGVPGDGAQPYGALIQATDGNFYGTTSQGAIFKITPRGGLTILYETGDPYLYGRLVQGRNGNFYGAANDVIFEITSAGIFTPLASFSGLSTAGMVLATDGNFYGTLAIGKTNAGALFNVTVGGTLTILYNFCSQTNCPDGSNPYGGLAQATNGTFYGTTYFGGADRDGTLYSLSMGLRFVTFVRAAGKVGQIGPILGQGFTGTTSVSLNGTPASFKVVSDTFIKATVPPGATTGYVTVTTPSGTLTSNVPFHVIP